jgi:hypothetical protein
MAHFEVERGPAFVALRWDIRNAPAMRWRVLRSNAGFATNAVLQVDDGQTMICETVECGAADEGVDDKRTYYYTVFVEDSKGVWHRQVKAEVKPFDRLQWHHSRYDVEASSGAVNCGEVVQEARILNLVMQHQTPGPDTGKGGCEIGRADPLNSPRV